MGRRSQYTAKQKAEIVVSVMTKQVTLAEACRRHGVTETTLIRWRDQVLEGMERSLADKARGSREAELEKEIEMLERKLGQVTLIADLRSKALQRLT